jgi:RNA polymerase sigma-70 factor, ECF subfamily
VDATGSQDELYERVADEYGTALDRLAHAYEADPDRRRDLLQEIHLALWRSFERFFLTLEEAEGEPDRASAEASVDTQKSLARLLGLIQWLEPVDRQLMLAYLEGMDAESMAEITGLSAANVWTKIHRIKNVLTRRFHAGGSDGG